MSPSDGRRRLVWVGGALCVALFIVFGLVPRIGASMMNQTIGTELPAASPEAVRLHASLAVADLHSDALLWDRDLLRRGTYGHTDVPRLIAGGMSIQAFTTVTKTPAGMNIESNPADSDQILLLTLLQLWPPRTWGSLTARALHQADKLHAAAAASGGRLTVLGSGDDLEAFLRDRAANSDLVAGFLGIEGAHALEGDLGNVDVLFAAGFRMFGLTHFFDNEVGGSAHGESKGGLTGFGREVIGRMEELGILVDLAHASPALIDDVLAITSRSVVVSHTGVKGTCDNRRNLDDGRLAAIAATGGLVGIGLWDTAICGETPADWGRAVRYAVGIAGVDHVGLGSDWDGSVGAIVDAAGTVHLTEALMREGFDADAIGKIMGGNVIRVLGESLPRRDAGLPR